MKLVWCLLISLAVVEEISSESQKISCNHPKNVKHDYQEGPVLEITPTHNAICDITVRIKEMPELSLWTMETDKNCKGVAGVQMNTHTSGSDLFLHSSELCQKGGAPEIRTYYQLQSNLILHINTSKEFTKKIKIKAETQENEKINLLELEESRPEMEVNTWLPKLGHSTGEINGRNMRQGSVYVLTMRVPAGYKASIDMKSSALYNVSTEQLNRTGSQNQGPLYAERFFHFRVVSTTRQLGSFSLSYNLSMSSVSLTSSSTTNKESSPRTTTTSTTRPPLKASTTSTKRPSLKTSTTFTKRSSPRSTTTSTKRSSSRTSTTSTKRPPLMTSATSTKRASPAITIPTNSQQGTTLRPLISTSPPPFFSLHSDAITTTTEAYQAGANELSKSDVTIVAVVIIAVILTIIVIALSLIIYKQKRAKEPEVSTRVLSDLNQNSKNINSTNDNENDNEYTEVIADSHLHKPSNTYETLATPDDHRQYDKLDVPQKEHAEDLLSAAYVDLSPSLNDRKQLAINSDDEDPTSVYCLAEGLGNPNVETEDVASEYYTLEEQ